MSTPDDDDLPDEQQVTDWPPVAAPRGNATPPPRIRWRDRLLPHFHHPGADRHD